MDNKLEKLLKVSDELCNDEKSPDINLFEMANLREYRHSAILGYLLGRKEQGRQVHLRSFLKRLFPKEMIMPTGDLDVKCEKRVECGNGKRPIDILVTADNFALIIENKCRGAGDQNEQISDYWKGVKNERRLEDKNIFVLYLPPQNAFMLPSETSIGDLGKRFGKGGDLEGHLLVRSFRDLVLPWLRKDVLPQINYGSGKLVDSLKCYIDLLESQFNAYSTQGDPREVVCEKFGKLTQLSAPGDMWGTATAWLDDIEGVLGGKVPSTLTEQDVDRLSDLRSRLWDVRSMLREKNPLLDPPNLSYEVYWLLRKNPTPFASRYIRSELESGLFFQNGRKQSAWDSIDFNGHTLECWFHVDEFVKFCKGEDSGTILTFGIGNVGENDYRKFENDYRKFEGAGPCASEYLPERRWGAFSVDNTQFAQAAAATGGEMLWMVAKTISEEAKSFSDAVEPKIRRACN